MVSHILEMGGYANYVWPAYCIVLLVLGFNLFFTLKEKHKIKKTVRQYYQSL